jgi:hypothetical protein
MKELGRCNRGRGAAAARRPARIHAAPAVPNLTRITVQGSTSAPSEWLRLTIDPHAAGVFSWENVLYCRDPAVSCP